MCLLLRLTSGLYEEEAIRESIREKLDERRRRRTLTSVVFVGGELILIEPLADDEGKLSSSHSCASVV